MKPNSLRVYEYQIKKYHEIRNTLLEKMGGVCSVCGSDYRLEFHHPKPKDWDSNGINGLVRMQRYVKDFESGNLQLLCKNCHDKI